MENEHVSFHPKGTIFFCTFRLADSLPATAIDQLRAERERELRSVGQDHGQAKILSYNDIQNNYFERYDDFLNKATDGPDWLKDERVASVVANALRSLDGKRYDLLCYCIMANHVHLLISLGQKDANGEQINDLSPVVSKIVNSLKRYTAREANKLLGRMGVFWQHESYDSIVRDDDDLERIIGDILQNPEKANLVTDWKEWKWSYIKEGLIEE